MMLRTTVQITNIYHAKYFTLFLSIVITLSACKDRSTETKSESQKKEFKTYIKTGSVERLNTHIDEIIPPGELPEILAEGFGFTEGPLWLPEQDILLFSDIYANAIYQWSEQDSVKLYLKPSGYTDTSKEGWNEGSNGLLLDMEGRLILCQHGDRRVARMDAPLDKPEPRFVTLADNWRGNRLNSPDDAVYNSRGDLFFTDPPYGLKEGFGDPNIELDYAGVFKLSAEGVLTLLKTSTLQTMPNGIGLSPDESRLYVGNSGESDDIFWMEYGIKEDGTLDEGEIFYDAVKEAKNEGFFPDGLKVREDGIIFAAGPGGLWIWSPDRIHLGTIKTGLEGQYIANCAFDEEGKYLYMTARSYLLRIKLR